MRNDETEAVAGPLARDVYGAVKRWVGESMVRLTGYVRREAAGVAGSDRSSVPLGSDGGGDK